MLKFCNHNLCQQLHPVKTNFYTCMTCSLSVCAGPECDCSDPEGLWESEQKVERYSTIYEDLD